MRTSSRRSRRLVALAAVTTLATGLLTACSSDDDGSGGSDGKITLNVGTFGVLGLKQAGLYEEYEKAHPNIKIKENVIERNDLYYPKLLTQLQSGAGVNDVAAIEVSNITEVVQTQAAKFEDLSKAKGVSKDTYLDWKWAQATTEDGKTVGLGVDIGPTALCYRKDLLKKAGLPTDREELAKAWAGDWDKYVALGEKYMKKAPKGTKFVDSASSVYNSVFAGATERYYDKSGKEIYEESQGRKDAWDTAMKVAQGDMSAKLKQFDPTWDSGFANAKFATVSCPAWMAGYIQEKTGPSGKGQWDMAKAPTAGNWGGTFLGVPSAGKHKKEATELAVWLTQPEQLAKVFAKQASFPSTPSVYDKLKPSAATSAYFNNAPITELFAGIAKDIPSAIYGIKDAQIGQSITDIGVLQVEQQGKTPEEGWEAAQEEIKDVLGQ
ncbi:ABC transporter substrate-binding protein [Streptomyces sp. NBC_01304]|uniref:ABC transporter substrate-binding protein n=1 Tax=Streptomyces sp. NBC_01304 TaxID=2903818 RepID=UPI002E1092DA|nr:extracellular solute-binding protein [Streptomyces sp. NBC_01304]